MRISINKLIDAVLSAAGGIKVEYPKISNGILLSEIVCLARVCKFYILYMFHRCCNFASQNSSPVLIAAFIMMSTWRITLPIPLSRYCHLGGCCVTCGLFQHATLWYRQSWMVVCPYCPDLVSHDWGNRYIQHKALWSKCSESVFPFIYFPLLEKG